MFLSEKHFIHAFICATILLSACSDDGFDESDFSSQSHPIIHGSPATDEYDKAVVAIAVKSDQKNRVYCSGTLIRPNVVLTAAHCVINEEYFPFNSLFSQKKIVVLLGDDLNIPEKSLVFGIDRLSIHPSFVGEKNDHDLALIWLDEEIPESVAHPLPFLEDTTRLPIFAHEKRDIEFVGYGYDERDQDGIRLSVTGSIQLYCQMNGKGRCGMNNAYGEYIIVPEGSFIHDIQKGGPCSGDSGGPILTSIEGQKTVIGVVSYGDADCAGYAVTCSTADHLKWINDSIQPKKKNKSGCAIHDYSRMPQSNGGLFLIFVIYLVCLGVLRRFSHSSY